MSFENSERDSEVQSEPVELSECSVIDSISENNVFESRLNTGFAPSFPASQVDVKLLDKVKNLTSAFSDVLIPMQKRNDEMCQYIDEANEYIDALEEQVKELEKENKELKSRLHDHETTV